MTARELIEESLDEYEPTSSAGCCVWYDYARNQRTFWYRRWTELVEPERECDELAPVEFEC